MGLGQPTIPAVQQLIAIDGDTQLIADLSWQSL